MLEKCQLVVLLIFSSIIALKKKRNYLPRLLRLKISVELDYGNLLKAVGVFFFWAEEIVSGDMVTC